MIINTEVLNRETSKKEISCANIETSPQIFDPKKIEKKTINEDAIENRLNRIDENQAKIMKSQEEVLNLCLGVLKKKEDIFNNIIKIEKERKKDKQVTARALVIFENIESMLCYERGATFQQSVLKGIEEIKNALLRIYDFVEKIG